MAKRNWSNCMYYREGICPKSCKGEGPKQTVCPLDSIPEEPDKDRSAARDRHHHKVKARKKSYETAKLLCSKADKLPTDAPLGEIERASRKVNAAYEMSQELRRKKRAKKLVTKAEAEA